MRALARAAHRRDAARRGVVVDLQVKLASWAETILFEVKTLHYSDKSTTPGAGAGTYGARPRGHAASGAVNRRARAVSLDRVKDAHRLDHELWPNRLDHELWPNRQQGGIGPIARRMRELGGVQALVVGGRLCGAQRRRPYARRRARRSSHPAHKPNTTWWIRQRRRAQQKHCCTQLSARQPGTLSQRSCSRAPLLRRRPSDRVLGDACRAPTSTAPRRAAAAAGLP
jgi:hypothetical protein